MSTPLRSCALLIACLLAGCGGASDTEPPAQAAPPPPPPPPPPPATEVAPLPEPYTAASPGVPAQSPPPPPAGGAQGAPPPPPPDQGQQVQEYPTGRWVYLVGQGWVWVPADATTTDMEGTPYAYLYTPAYGWTWYVSPWGLGPYHYGVWVRHPWHPVGMHGYWVAHPGVSGRLGGGFRGGGRGGGRR